MTITSFPILSRAIVPGILACLYCACTSPGQHSDFTVTIDGARIHQQIDGFGVNANTASWGETQLEPALDLLIDTLKAGIWRVVIETEQDWESENDNGDPFRFNREYYDRQFETPKFRKAWEQIEYLNNKGISENLIISIMGGLPVWMGRDIIPPEMEDEFVELHLSFLHYAVKTRQLRFGLYSPVNETDLFKAEIEGPHTEPQQFARVMRKLSQGMKEYGLDGIRLVLPDVASMDAGIGEYLPELLKDSLVMARVGIFGFHSYSGYYAPVDSFTRQTGYWTLPLWMTEFNAWRDGLDNGQTGVYDFAYAGQCVKYLFEFLENGASACLVWEAYDTPYEHHHAMSYWGILGLDPETASFFPRKHFYALAQVFRFIPPGARRIDVSHNENPELKLLAFHHAGTGTVTVTGLHSGTMPVSAEFHFRSLPGIRNLEFFHTDSIHNLHRSPGIQVERMKFRAVIPAGSVFTITGKAS